jgi:hypothetical protein
MRENCLLGQNSDERGAVRPPGCCTCLRPRTGALRSVADPPRRVGIAAIRCGSRQFYRTRFLHGMEQRECSRPFRTLRFRAFPRPGRARQTTRDSCALRPTRPRSGPRPSWPQRLGSARDTGVCSAAEQATNVARLRGAHGAGIFFRARPAGHALRPTRPRSGPRPSWPQRFASARDTSVYFPAEQAADVARLRCARGAKKLFRARPAGHVLRPTRPRSGQFAQPTTIRTDTS